MPRIPTFDAGPGELHPSEAGSAAFREAGAVTQRNAARVGQMLEQEGRSISGGISAIGGALGEMQDKAQAHTDAQAEIDFQNQLTKAEVSAVGGVNAAGTPTNSDGQPIQNNPGRGANVALPPDANVPHPGDYVAAVSRTTDNHRGFLDNLLGAVTGLGVSQKAQDRMALQAAQSNRRLQVHAMAVQGEVDFNHALSATQQTINTTFGALGRGEIPLDTAIEHIDGAFNAFQGSLSGDFASKGAPLIKQQREQAYNAAIWNSIRGDLAAGRPDNAARTLNNPKYDPYIGGQREQIENQIRQYNQAQVADQNSARTQRIQQEHDAALSRTDQYIKDAAGANPKLKLTDIQTDQTYDNRADLRTQAMGAIEAMQRFNAGDLKVAPEVSHGTTIELMRRMTLGEGEPERLGDKGPIYQALIDGKLNKQDFLFVEGQFDRAMRPEMSALGRAREGFFKSYAGAIDGAYATTGTHSPLGLQRVYDAKQEAIRQEQELAKIGQDPASLYNPASQNFFGRAGNLDRFHISATDDINYRVQQMQRDQKTGAPINSVAPQTTTKPAETAPITLPQGLTPDDVKQNYPAGTRFIIPSGPRAGQIGTVPPDLNKPVVMPRGTTPDQIKQQLQPGQKFIIEHDDGKKYMGTVPGKRSMNFAPEDGGMENSAGQQAINSAIAPVNAHEDKNLFSSGRYEAMGIAGGVGENLTRIEVQGKPVTVNAQAAPHFKAFLDELTARGYKVDDIGGYNDRMKRGSLSSYSEHAFGNAIDINPDRNPFHSRKNDLPSNVAQIAAKYGLIWGGNWSGRSADPMHFEWAGKGGLTQFAGL